MVITILIWRLKLKLSECNARQRKAFINICHAANWLLGGLENQMCDSEEGSADWAGAKKLLSDHDYLVNELYRMATTEVYEDGFCGFGKGAERFLKDIRFCGKGWLMERCDARIRKEGY